MAVSNPAGDDPSLDSFMKELGAEQEAQNLNIVVSENNNKNASEMLKLSKDALIFAMNRIFQKPYLLAKRGDHFIVPHHQGNTIGVSSAAGILGSTVVEKPIVDSGAQRTTINTTTTALLEACNAQLWQWRGFLVGGHCTVKKLRIELRSLQPVEYNFGLSLLRTYTGFSAFLNAILLELTVEMAQFILNLIETPAFKATLWKDPKAKDADPKQVFITQLTDYIQLQNLLKSQNKPLSKNFTLLGNDLLLHNDLITYANKHICLVSKHRQNIVQPSWCYVLLEHMCDLIEEPVAEQPNTTSFTVPSSFPTPTPTPTPTVPNTSTNPTPITSTIEQLYLSVDDDPMNTPQGRLIEEHIDLIRKKREESVVYEGDNKIVKYELTEEDQEWLRKYDSLVRYGTVD